MEVRNLQSVCFDSFVSIGAINNRVNLNLYFEKLAYKLDIHLKSLILKTTRLFPFVWQPRDSDNLSAFTKILSWFVFYICIIAPDTYLYPLQHKPLLPL